MRRIATLCVLPVVLSGCAQTQTGTPAAPTTTTAASSISPTSTSSFEPLTTDPADCFDGVCTVRVPEGTAFPLDADAFGLTGFVATHVGADGVECVLYVRPQGAFTLTLKEPGQSAAGRLDVATWVTLVSNDTTSAVVALGHTEP